MSNGPLIKRGCRPLKLGEQVQPGDYVWFRSRWEEVSAPEAGKVIGRYSYRHCRPLLQSKIENQKSKMRRNSA